jgi:ABC-type arginine transport system ATPase subunit
MAAEKGRKERQAVLMLPDIGLQDHEVNALKKEFHSSIVQSMRGREDDGDTVVVVVVVVVVEEGLRGRLIAEE